MGGDDSIDSGSRAVTTVADGGSCARSGAPGDAPATAVRAHLLDAGARYWSRGTEWLADAAAPITTAPPAQRFVRVALPEWARDLGVGIPSSLLVDAACVQPGDAPAFARCDWWRAAFLHLTGAYERDHERRRGPSQSYALRLDCEPALFDHAWVNRICLLLRRAAARRLGRDEDATFGPLPAAEIVLTHDVDALAVQGAVRFKQGTFQLFNAARLTARGRLGAAAQRLRQSGRFLAGGAREAPFASLLAAMARMGRTAVFHLFAAAPPPWRDWRARLFDPGYDVQCPSARALLHDVARAGHRIGLHPSFDSYRDGARIAAERARLEGITGTPVLLCRQHWLRFSWADTWAAQAAAGLRLDMTLGFNDRPGFRHGAALCCAPWAAAPGLRSVPLLFMDSHFYDYELVAASPLPQRLARWVDEVRAVRGIASVLWHPHTLDSLYGWRAGFEQLLELLGPGELPACVLDVTDAG